MHTAAECVFCTQRVGYTMCFVARTLAVLLIQRGNTNAAPQLLKTHSKNSITHSTAHHDFACLVNHSIVMSMLFCFLQEML